MHEGPKSQPPLSAVPDPLLAQLAERFDAEGTVQRPDLVVARVAAAKVVPALGWLKHETPYVQLTLLSAVDWIEDGEFQLSYLVTAPSERRTLLLTTRIDREAATAESVHTLWPQAVTYEQELNEMYGIHFPGSPRQGVDFVLEGWTELPPMRRDFDTLEYCERVHPARDGRETVASRPYIGKAAGEKGYLHD